MPLTAAVPRKSTANEVLLLFCYRQMHKGTGGLMSLISSQRINGHLNLNEPKQAQLHLSVAEINSLMLRLRETQKRWLMC